MANTFWINIKMINSLGAWVAQSVKCLSTLAQVMMSWFMGLSPTSDCTNGACLLGIPSLPLSLRPSPTHVLLLSKINNFFLRRSLGNSQEGPSFWWTSTPVVGTPAPGNFQEAKNFKNLSSETLRRGKGIWLRCWGVKQKHLVVDITRGSVSRSPSRSCVSSERDPWVGLNLLPRASSSVTREHDTASLTRWRREPHKVVYLGEFCKLWLTVGTWNTVLFAWVKLILQHWDPIEGRPTGAQILPVPLTSRARHFPLCAFFS